MDTFTWLNYHVGLYQGLELNDEGFVHVANHEVGNASKCSKTKVLSEMVIPVTLVHVLQRFLTEDSRSAAERKWRQEHPNHNKSDS